MAQLGIYYFNGTSFSTATSVFTDAALTTLAPDGYYSNAGIVRQQLSGVLLNAQPCNSCAVPCGSGISASISSQNGIFNATVDVANDTGAIIVYGYWGSTIPDGVDIIYNSTHYNRWTAQGNHDTVTLVDGAGTTVDYAGINNQGTGLPTYLGKQNASLISGSPYNNTPSGACAAGDKPQNYVYDQGSNNYVAQGTYQSLTVVNSQIGYGSGSSPVFTAVIPKPNLTPTGVVVDIYAPICNTAFSWDLSCPAALRSWSGSNPQNTDACATPTTTYYFAPNATGTGPSFTVDTNTIPNIGNFVFKASDGSVYLNDNNVLKYYITGGFALGVRNGVVVSKTTCTSP